METAEMKTLHRLEDDYLDLCYPHHTPAEPAMFESMDNIFEQIKAKDRIVLIHMSHLILFLSL